MVMMPSSPPAAGFVARGAPRRGLILTACMMATATAAIEATIVATAMPTIVADLHGAVLYAWVFSAYMLTQAVTIPIYGRLADQYGRRCVFAAGSGLFFLGSALCGAAGGMPSLILFRALQGCGAGAIQPIAYTIVGDLYTPTERARIQGWLSGVFGAAAILGPTLGALLVTAGGWRFVFWINLPFSAASIAMILGLLKEQRSPGRHALDLAGSALLVLGAGAILLAVDRGLRLPPATAWALLLLGLGLLAALVRHERRAAEPILPLELWKNRLVVLVSLGSFTVGATILSLTAFLPSFVQGPMGRGADAAGLVLGTMMVIWTTGSITAGQLMAFLPYRATAAAGSLAIMGGAGLLLSLAPLSSIWQAMAGAGLVGIGLGFCNTTWVVSVQAAVAREQRGAATSASMFMRFLGQALGVAVAGAVLGFGLAHALPGSPDPLGQLLVAGAARSPALAATVSRCFCAVFAMAELLGIATLVLALGIPRHLGTRTRPADC
jgi:MFS family permease